MGEIQAKTHIHQEYPKTSIDDKGIEWAECECGHKGRVYHIKKLTTPREIAKEAIESIISFTALRNK